MNRRSATWLSAAGVPVVVVAAALVIPMQASAAVDLPDKSPEQVLAMIAESDVSAFSGTFEQSSDLGLPEIPAGSGTEGAASALELLTGSHTVRVFVDGPSQQRVQVLDRLAERDVIRNGADVWYFDSDEQEATHVVLPDGESTTDDPRSDARTPATPAELAAQLVQKLDETSSLGVDADTRIAGRTAYDLVLTPDSEDTLVGSVSIAVDSETGLPLRVRVTAAGQEAPAFQTAFTELTVGAPDAALFDFTPPVGTEVTEQQLPEGHSSDTVRTDAASAPEPTVVGSGWSSIVVLPAGTVPAEFGADPLFAQVTEQVEGGRVVSTSLVTVLFTDDGRVLAGSVSADALLAAAAG